MIDSYLTELTELPETNRDKVIELLIEAKIRGQLIRIPLKRISYHGITSHVIIMPAEYSIVNDGTYLEPSIVLTEMEFNQ